MSDSHAARPRLVVDNSSSSDNSRPCSRARRSKAKCRRDGIPRSGQFRIVDSERPSRPPISSKPPNRIIKSVVVGMRNRLSHIGTNCNPDMGLFIKSAKLLKGMTFLGQNGTMWDMPRKRKKEDEAFGQHLRAARTALFGSSAAGFARQVGINEQTYRNYERGDRKPGFKELRKFATAGISLNWLFLKQYPMLIAQDAREVA